MGRWRPPRKQGSKYITPEGHARLRQELDHLWLEKRPQVTKTVAAAAAQGDRSENAEYIYGKKQLREIDSRVRFLRKRLEDMVVVDAIPDEKDKVFFGAWVRLENEDGHLTVYRIVGPDEFDLNKGYISVDSPMAKSLLGRKEGDEVSVKQPDSEALYYLDAVQYQPFD